jgi:hypothetical protein
MVVAAWRFAGSGTASESMLEPLYELGNEIKGARSESELEQIEKRIDDILKAELARNVSGVGADGTDMAAAQPGGPQAPVSDEPSQDFASRCDGCRNRLAVSG